MSNSSQPVAHLLSQVTAHQNAFTQHKSLYAKRFSPDFNPCCFIDFNELKISQIIRWLLDPKESHGQGARFLSVLLDQINLNWSLDAQQSAEVYAEFDAGDKGRIDVWCTSAEGVIAIENKLWGAAEGEKQIERYLAFMEHEFSRDRASRLIYLPQRQVNSNFARLHSAAVVDGRLAFWSFVSEFKQWLESCRIASQSSRISAFIGDLSDHLRQTIEGAITVEETQFVVAQSMASNEAIHSAFSIIAAEREIKLKLIELMSSQLQDFVEQAGWRFFGWSDDNRKEVGPATSFEKWSFIQIDFQDGKDFKFKISFDAPKHDDLYFGVAPALGPRSVPFDLRQSLIGKFGEPSKHTLASEWWYWHRRAGPQDEYLKLEQNWNRSPKAWEDVRSGKAAKNIFETAAAFKAKLDELR